ncbi:MAG TPA: nitrate- and nitrite sensing domain-containing protein [Streptosporangiaceae bacterium]|nr:nitrate- and nitrite sensing domain-containing protein [Streptosporangiaceae bacterium]
MPSRTKKTRDVAPGSVHPQPPGAAVVDPGQPADLPARSGSGEMDSQRDGFDGRAPGDRPRSRMLRNWRVRSRLVLLIGIPTATAVALGASSIVNSWQSAVVYQRTEVLASLSSRITNLAFEVEAERDDVVSYIAGGSGGRAGTLSGKQSAADKTAAADLLSVVRQQIGLTGQSAASVVAGINSIGSGYPPAVTQDAQAVIFELETLAGLRTQSLNTSIAASDVITKYQTVIDALFAFDDQIALGSSDSQLTSTTRTLGQISRIENEYATQRGIVMYALVSGQMDVNLLNQLTTSRANYQAELTQFSNFATPDQVTAYKKVLAGSLQDRVDSAELTVLAYVNSGRSLGTIPIISQDWFGDATETIARVHAFEQYLVNAAINRAKALRAKAIFSAALVGGVVLLVLVLSLLFTVFVGRSMVRPLRRLRAGALEVAGVRLPEAVRRMNEADSESVPADVDPIDVDSFDEIGEVARAFDQVHREALRLAATEAALRGNVNAMFVNLSRRSQSLVERQIRLIDELEQGEQDPERLGSLFQMDHLATRMRRNSENLLVLAGHESSRRWHQPVPLVDVLRAAISEIEQYERVMLNVQPGIAVRGPAVNDVVHLIAELAENATSFSSADTPVSVSGHLLSSGGVLLDITDEGVGMGAEEMAHANWRLDNPPVVDVAVSRRMGLFVVARLAARHGIRVRLRSASSAGLTALVWLPDEVVVHDGTGSSVSPGRLQERQGRIVLEPSRLLPPGSSEWPGPGRPSTQDEVTAARAPRFGSPGSENGENWFSGQPGMSEQDDPALAGHGFAGQGMSGSGMPGLGLPGQGFSRADLAGTRFGGGDYTGQEYGGQGYGEQDGGRGGAELGPQRIPGAGPHPGRPGSTSTGPIPTVESAQGGLAQPGPATGPSETGGPATGPVGYGPQAAGPAWQGGDQPQGPVGAGWSGGQQSQPAGQWPNDQVPQTVLGAPVARSRPPSGTFRTQESLLGPGDGGVIVPPPASLGEENRLPIFEAVESDWFRRGRPSVDWPDGKAERGPSPSWSSPADEGWRAAEAAAVPASGGTTRAGLPRRVPKANLIPGTAFDNPAPAPVRSAAVTRERFASLQRGMREGRAASGPDKDDGSGDIPGDG